MDFTAECS